MPLYEYACDDCGHRFEKIQKFSDAPIETCPACGGRVRKLPSSPAIQFKGSGWYITDYARAGKSDSGKSDAGKSDEGKSDEGKSATAKSGEAASPDSSSKSTESTSDTTSDKKTTKTESPAPAASSAKSS